MWARVHKGPIVSGQIPTATADSVAALVALPVDTGNARRTRAATALKPAGAAGAGVVGAIMVSASRKDQVTLYPCRVSLMLNRIRHLFAHDDEPYVQPPEITLSPIGLVRNRVKEPMPSGWEKVTSRIIVRPEIEEALLGLEGYSHIIVLFWPHLVPDDERGSKLRLHPLDDPEYALQGILATRSQIRFNPVLVSVVPLLTVKGHVLEVRGLDAVDGTPVLDVKPYIPYYDALPDARLPAWIWRTAPEWIKERWKSRPERG